jgi:hypothetical protein
MADAKKKKAPAKPTAPFIGYGTNVAAGKKITKSVKKTVVAKVKKANDMRNYKDSIGPTNRKITNKEVAQFQKRLQIARAKKK